MSVYENKATLITPYGQGGVAVILGLGKNINEAIQPFFSTSKKIKPSQNIYYGTLYDDKREIIDQVLIRCFEYKEVDAIEICCHGGIAITEAIFQLLTSIDILRSDDLFSPSENVALQNFIHSKTDLVAKIFAYQLNGIWNSYIQEIVTHINQDNFTQAITLLESTLESFTIFNMITDPQSIVIAGKPNSGKSTLMNQLVGRERVIVDSTPGTTRDAIKVLVSLSGFPFYIYDTAGIRDSDNVVERMGIEKTFSMLDSGRHILWVIDSSLPPVEEEIPENALVLLNKVDLQPRFIEEYKRLYRNAICISAKKGLAIEEIARRLVPGLDKLQQSFPMIMSEDQYNVIVEVIRLLEERDTKKALLLLAGTCFYFSWSLE
ncbi:tRNA modification GTPase MnmE [Candidatus Uabimicrobium amorphum]|uniref:tRNA modification GTPase MnmE n=2 Tax=Uabimicrobium amorphum TaxID=2596890 RepID=A0A5S9IQP5_UABAM|nr:tRNA modification GTPase MnmE [Candidatus Uabimicrobium amorphum]